MSPPDLALLSNAPAGAAEGRDFLMHARFGMMRELNRHIERVFNSSRKDTRWGKHKIEERPVKKIQPGCDPRRCR